MYYYSTRRPVSAVAQRLILSSPPTHPPYFAAFSFAPNLRPIIAAEEAISNLNETPSRSSRSAGYTTTITVVRLGKFFSPKTIVCLHATSLSLSFSQDSVFPRNFDPVHATLLLLHPHRVSFYLRGLTGLDRWGERKKKESVRERNWASVDAKRSRYF